ncbi:hypothetical protein H6503_05700 [Candidatus Woesearchaeota archaeon]|nr:hypothetical protein [Candidatus Woesearchaeota archaeon]
MKLETVCMANRIRSKILYAHLVDMQGYGMLPGISTISSSGIIANGGETYSPERLLAASELAEIVLKEDTLDYDWNFTRFEFEEGVLYIPSDVRIKEDIKHVSRKEFLSVPEITGISEVPDPRGMCIDGYRRYNDMVSENLFKIVDYINSICQR